MNFFNYMKDKIADLTHDSININSAGFHWYSSQGKFKKRTGLYNLKTGLTRMNLFGKFDLD